MDNQLVFINGIQVKVIAYFMLEATREQFIIYSDINHGLEIELGQVVHKENRLEVHPIERTTSFIMKKLIGDFVSKDLSTVKTYQYLNQLDELQDQFSYVGSQKIVLDTEKKKALEEFIQEINEHNDEILTRAKDEYYMQLVDEQARGRKIVIILIIILLIIIAIIAKIVIDFLAK